MSTPFLSPTTMSFLADALWNELKYGVLAHSRQAYDACAALHKENKIDAVIARAADAFQSPADNAKDAVEHVWGHIKRHELRKTFEEKQNGRRADFLNWLMDVAVEHAPELTNSRLFLEPPLPDRAWVNRNGAWDLAWRHDGDWKLKALKQVRESGVDEVESLLVVTVGGVTRPNPKLPPA